MKVTVNNSGTTLGGSGTIGGSVNVASSGANLSPGSTGTGSTAILHTGALTLATGSNFRVDINGTTAGSGYDQLSVTGAFGHPELATAEKGEALFSAAAGEVVKFVREFAGWREIPAS